MFGRNIYLRTGLRIPTRGWVVDLGANSGLFTVLCAVEGANVIAVEVQRGFVPEIERLVAINGIAESRVKVEIATASSVDGRVTQRGVIADDDRWRTASHAETVRPARRSVPDLMAHHHIGRIGLLKMDIEGSEFTVLDDADRLDWLSQVDQLAIEVHPEHGDVNRIRRTLLRHGFQVMTTDDDGLTPTPIRPAAYVYARRPAS